MYTPNGRVLFTAPEGSPSEAYVVPAEELDNVLCYYKNLTENCWVFKQFVAGSLHV